MAALDVLVGSSSAAESLAYELRRIATQVMDGREQQPDVGLLAARIANSFGLSLIEVDLCLSVLGSELDHEFAALLESASGRSGRALLSLLVDDMNDRLGLHGILNGDSALLRKGLLRMVQLDGGPALATTRRLRSSVLGHDLLAALPEYAQRITEQAPTVDWARVPSGLLKALKASTHGAMCVVTGPIGVGKTSWACGTALALSSVAPLRIDVARAARAPRHAAEEIRELLEDATLVGCVVIIDNAHALLRAETRLSLMIEDVLDAMPARLLLVVGEQEPAPASLMQRALGHVHIEPPPPSVRRSLWQRALATQEQKHTLADDLVLTPRQIANAITLIEVGAEPAVAAFDQLPKGQNLTLPDRTTARLDALILPQDVRAEILELIAAIAARTFVHEKIGSARGSAITALFDGDSGTGKTFACEVVAAEVGLPLMRVNVASLVDKYIGETEKNLARVFALAQAQGGILFFDEADALFGTRTDVSRSQDRYANLETNLLLQLMEQFAGIVLLTTNLKRNIDPAFMRRIMFKVYFETPEPPERERLWRSILPTSEFETNIDFARLAKTFELAGGSIRAALLRAAYRAAARGGKIAMKDLVECAQLETQGMGRVASW